VSFIVTRSEEPVVSDVGGKARALAALDAAGFPVPAWFVVTHEALATSVPDFASSLEPGDEDRMRIRLAAWSPSAAVSAAIADALAGLGPGPFAVRSSAADEDGAGQSFAGQLESYLFVPAAEVPARVADVWRSAYAPRVWAYRRQHGLSPVPSPPAVLVQRMVNADAAGVAFSADPVSGARGRRVVSAVLGLGDALVSGEADADTWHVDRGGDILSRSVVDKACAHRYDATRGAGVCPQPVAESRRREPALSDAQVRAVAQLAQRAEAHFGRPQDIEWAIEDGALWLLQSRAITSLANLPDPDGERIVWDNSNIAESYNGVTTPLTFSFARHAYQEVYRQSCFIMGVTRARIEDNRKTFANMLGLIRGRVYYNLNNWYRVLALLPGFRLNRRFMEQMMGVKEPMPAELVAELERAGAAERFADGMLVARLVWRLLRNLVTLGVRRRRFYQRLDAALADSTATLAQQRLDELAAYYRKLEGQLLTRWDAPIINDFFAMIFYGVLRRLAQTWCADADGTLQNDLLCGEGGMISSEPAQRVKALARLAAAEPALAKLLLEASPATIHAALPAYPAFDEAYRSYLAAFGDRCLEELKLESATLHDDPTTLLRSIGHLAMRAPTAAETTVPDVSQREAAERRVTELLATKPIKRRIFGWVLANARARVRDRENLRFERTRLFGRVRRVFVEIGARLFALGKLDAPRDVFYLDVDEALGFAEGTATITDIASLARLRKQEFERYRALPAPPDRLETRGAVHQGSQFDVQAVAPAAFDGDALAGLGCCPGVVEKEVRVIVDPRGATIDGEIMVAERTDPGWIMLFPACSGLLVERGSLLSHSAIVARELGIPAIVGIPGVTRWLKNGDRVEMNGATGKVRKLGPAT